MATETQKKFREEMKKLRKELKQNNPRGFYHFFERDYAQSYYERKKKRERMVLSISLASVLVIFWSFFAIYHKDLPVVSKPVFSSKAHLHSQVEQYLREVKVKESRINAAMKYRRENLSIALQSQSNRNIYYEKINKFADEINSEIKDYETLEHPEVLNTYATYILQKLNLCYQILDRTDELKNIEDPVKINEIIIKTNKLILALNEYNTKSRNELIDVLDRTNMKYEVLSDGTIVIGMSISKP